MWAKIKMITACVAAAVVVVGAGAPVVMKAMAQDTKTASEKLLDGEPSVKKVGEGFEISFKATKPVDVTVRILDKDGNVVRHLASGMVGLKKAASPFAPKSLSQKIIWDGKDDSGKSVSEKAVVRVLAGMQPRLDGFIGWEPGLLGRSVGPIDVDDKGNLYVTTDAGGKERDLDIMIFNRSGVYQRTLLPYNPNLPEGALKDEKHLQWIESRPGVKVPKCKYFESIHMYLIQARPGWGSDSMCCGTGGKVYFGGAGRAGSGTIFEIDDRGLIVRKFIGGGALAINAAGKTLYHRVGQSWASHRFKGPVRKTELQTLSAVDHLTSTKEANFKNIIAMAVDDAENLYVAEAGSGVVRIFKSDGKYLGELTNYNHEGKEFSLGNIIMGGLKVSKRGDAVYVMIQGPEKNISRLVKLSGLESKETVWVKDFISGGVYYPCRVALDRQAKIPVLWVGHNQDNCAALSRITDLGDKIGDVRTIGVGRPESLRRPGTLVADSKGNLIVIDLRIEKNPKANLRFASALKKVLRPAEGEGQIVLIPGTKANRDVNNYPIHADRIRGHIYTLGRGGVLRFDNDMKPVSFTSTGTNYFKTRGGNKAVAVDRQGNIYVVVTTQRTRSKKLPRGATKEQIKEYIDSGEKDGVYPHIRSRIGWCHVDMYTPDGALKKQGLLELHGGGGMAVDSHGGIYVMDTLRCETHAELSVLSQKDVSAIGFLVKFSSQGGWRDRDELWVHQRVSPVDSLGCGCTRSNMTIDADDRVFVTDSAGMQVKMLDTQGNLISYIGNYGNRDCAGPKSAFPKPEIALRTPFGVAVVGDMLYISDQWNKRIVRCKLDYTERKNINLK